jgi:hypothetical protein
MTHAEEKQAIEIARVTLQLLAVHFPALKPQARELSGALRVCDARTVSTNTARTFITNAKRILKDKGVQSRISMPRIANPTLRTAMLVLGVGRELIPYAKGL